MAHALRTRPEFETTRAWLPGHEPPPFRIAALGYLELPTAENPGPSVFRFDDPAVLAVSSSAGAPDVEILVDPDRAARYLTPLVEHAPDVRLWALLLHVPSERDRYRSSVWFLTPAGKAVTGFHHTGTWLELAETLAPRPSDDVSTTIAGIPEARLPHQGPFREGKASILSAREFQAAIAAMRLTDHPSAWQVIDDVAVYRKSSSSGGYVDVQREGTGSTPEAVLAELARIGGDALSDTYASITARYIASGAPADGIWVNVNDVLRDRGVVQLPSGGHRTEDRLSVGQHLGELTNWRLVSKLPSWGGKQAPRRRPFVIESQLLSMTDTVYQTVASGEPVPIAVRCALGDYARYFLTNGAGRQTCLLMQAALRYDPFHEATEKRLAYHFAFRFRMAAFTRDYDHPVTVEALFRDAYVDIDGSSLRANPSRTILRWTRALDQLVSGGVIDCYEFLPGKDQPLRSKLDRWLAQRIRITPPTTITRHYASIGDRRPRVVDARAGS